MSSFLLRYLSSCRRQEEPGHDVAGQPGLGVKARCRAEGGQAEDAWLKYPGGDQDVAQGDELGVVHPEHVDGRAPNRRAADEGTTIETEMIAPFVPSWMIEPRHLAGRRVASGQVRPFVDVTVVAG